MLLSNIEITPIDKDKWGSDLNVVNAARVSFSKESHEMSDSDVRLINYLAEHKHFSPFNHAFLSFRIKVPIFVARQLVKHKFLPWNEVSRRYVDSDLEFYIPETFHLRAANIKQGSSKDIHPKSDYIHYRIYETCRIIDNAYKELIELGVPPEEARMVTTVNSMTEVIWSGTLGAFLDMLNLRIKDNTQSVTRAVAEEMAKHVKEVFPISFDARIEYE